MQKQFKYIYNNEEVSREDFEKLAGDSFKWFDGDSVVSVPFSSFDSSFTGNFKSRRQINDHLDSVLNVYQNKVTEDIINKPKCSPQCFCDGSCKKPQQKNLGWYKIPNVKVDATRHKAREDGKFHKEIVGDLEGINRPPSTYNGLEKYINSLKQLKDDVITNSNRGEKETMEYLQGVKESQSVDKAPIFTYCKVNKNALEALSLRALYGHIKYKETDSDWQNFTRVPNALEEYANASFRHALGIGEEDEETHLVAEAWNAVAKLEVFLRNKLNKS